MNLPTPIEVGLQGWKKRDIEIRVIQMVRRSTTPQSGWTIYQKLAKKNIRLYSGKEICIMMYDLYKRGYIEHAGFSKDSDRDSVYTQLTGD